MVYKCQNYVTSPNRVLGPFFFEFWILYFPVLNLFVFDQDLSSFSFPAREEG